MTIAERYEDLVNDTIFIDLMTGNGKVQLRKGKLNWWMISPTMQAFAMPIATTKKKSLFDKWEEYQLENL